MTRLAFCIAILLASCLEAKAEGIKVIAFDCFGTVFDLSQVDREEVRDYIQQVRRPKWSPLELPTSWESMPAHPDSAEGIERLRERFIVVTCSNAPLGLTAKMAKRAEIHFDAIIPLEIRQVYKPDPLAYLLICDVMGCQPEEVMMITGNEGSPDLVAPKQLGMQTMRIRGDGGPQTIIELANLLIKKPSHPRGCN